jgi:hypothetical protein
MYIKRYVKVPSKWVSLSIGEPGGDLLAGTFWIEKDNISGFLLGPRGHKYFKVGGGHLEFW